MTADGSVVRAQASSKHLARFGVALFYSVTGVSCFVEIADPLTDVDANVGGSSAGDGGSAGGNGGIGGSAGIGGAGGASGFSGATCDAGPPDDPQTGCGAANCKACSLQNVDEPRCASVTSGSAGAPDAGALQYTCAIGKCKANFLDCNQKANDGCEFASTPTSGTPIPTPLIVQPALNITVDGNDDDWAAFCPYAITAVCALCPNNLQDNTQPVVNPKDLPASTDLRAEFSLAWTDIYLYLRVRVHDDQLIQGPKPYAEDGIEILIDGALGETGPSSDDHQLFIGLSGSMDDKPYDMNNEPTPDVDVRVAVGRSATNDSYVIEARMQWMWILQGKFTQFGPKPGASYGLTIAVNDWDNSAQRGIDRESHLFSKDPGPDYRFNSSNLGRIVLGSGAP